MKRLALMVFVAALLLYACKNESKTETATESTASSDTAKEKEVVWVPVDSATMMKAWMDYGTPGKAHEMLASSNGTWAAEITMWMSPDAPPTTSKGTVTNKMVFDNRYQLSSFKGDFMGAPFEGMGTMAYDNFKKAYVSTWIDNMGTGIMKMEGNYDEASKTMTMTGKMVDPSQGKECDMKQVHRIVDNNSQVMEMYGPDPMTGKQFKNMEMKLTRKS